MDLLPGDIPKDYSDSLFAYRKLYECIKGRYCAHVIEAYKMAEMMVSRKVQSEFAYELIRLAMSSESFEDNTFQKMDELIGEHGSEFNLSEDVTYITQNQLLTSMGNFMKHLRNLAHFIRSEIKKINLTKVYRTMCLTQHVVSSSASLPQSVIEILLFEIYSGVRFHSGYTDALAAGPEVPELQKCVLGKFESEFVSFLRESFSRWREKMESHDSLAFEDLPQRFVDVLSGYRKLAAVMQKIILNEYCRTTAIVFVMTHFLHASKDDDERFALWSTLESLRTSVLYIQGPKLSAKERSFFEIIETLPHVFSRQHMKFLSCGGMPCGTPKDVLHRAIAKCSFLNRMNISHFPDPFALLASVKNLAESEYCDCYGKNNEFRFSFDGDFAIRPERFFHDRDFTANLPLLSKTVMKQLTLTGDNSRASNIADETSTQIIEQLKICGSPMEN